MPDTQLSIFESEPDEALERRLDADAEAAIAAGRVIPHSRVKAWLESWGTPEELPCPKP